MAITRDVVSSLAKVLADAYAMQIKTQYFHWNVSGPLFYPLHLLFDRQYEQLAEGIDLIAERIKALGFIAPGSFSSFVKRTTVIETVTLPTDSNGMLIDLITGYAQLIGSLEETVELAEETKDAGTEDLCSQQIFLCQKSVWMLTNSTQQ